MERVFRGRWRNDAARLRVQVTEQPYIGNIQRTDMGSDELDPIVLEIMATLDNLLLAEMQARFQVSALEAQEYPLAATFEMVRDMEADAALDEALSGFGFEQHALDDDAELWISDELGLMVFLFFTASDGRSYTYRIVRFEVVGEDEISL